MSIINDALRKADRDKERSQVSHGRAKSTGRWGFLVLLVILLAGAAPILSKTWSGSSHLETTNRRAQFGIEQIPSSLPMHRPMPGRNPDFRVSGIVYSKTGSYCLINGKIMRVGDMINGAKLVDISNDSATLEAKGRRMTLAIGS